MFKRSLKPALVLVTLAILYLTLWPVPIDPVAWEAPENQGYTGDFAQNSALSGATRISLGDYHGPEDAAFGADGKLYLSTHEGAILQYDPATDAISVFAETGGRPLGIEFGPDNSLYVADAYRGLLKIDPKGNVTKLSDKTSDGSPILYADDLDIAQDGTVYFSDASTKFGAEAYGGTLPASLLDLLEHGPNGRILKYNPVTQETTVIADGYSFANGVALSQDENHLLFVETGSYAIHRLALNDDEPPQAIVTNLPGFPDNINTNPDGTFWVGLVSPRSDAVDQLALSPFLRKVVQRLPAFIQPKPQRYGLVFRMDQNGEILETLQDPSGGYALATGAIEGPDGRLYITSLTEPDLAALAR